MDSPVELRQLRYFVAVAEELHFGRAAERLHMSQSPLSRAIRELERDVGAVLFIRTTRHVELTPAGSALLSRARVALTEVDVALDEARRAAQPGPEVIAIGHGPFSRSLAERVAEQVADGYPDVDTRLVEGVAPELAGRVASRELAGALMLETPAAARRYGVRIDAVRDEPLLAALPKAHRYADAEAIPIGAFADELVLLPREPSGRAFNLWLRAIVRGAGYELEQTLETLSASWDHRMLPVAEAEAVSVLVADWTQEAIAGVVAVPFDPPLSFPIDLATRAPADQHAERIVGATLRLRDGEGWLTHRPAHTTLPED